MSALACKAAGCVLSNYLTGYCFGRSETSHTEGYCVVICTRCFKFTSCSLANSTKRIYFKFTPSSIHVKCAAAIRPMRRGESSCMRVPRTRDTHDAPLKSRTPAHVRDPELIRHSCDFRSVAAMDCALAGVHLQAAPSQRPEDSPAAGERRRALASDADTKRDSPAPA